MSHIQHYYLKQHVHAIQTASKRERFTKCLSAVMNWRWEVPGEEDRLPNVCLCSLTNVAWYVLILRLLVA